MAIGGISMQTSRIGTSRKLTNLARNVSMKMTPLSGSHSAFPGYAAQIQRGMSKREKTLSDHALLGHIQKLCQKRFDKRETLRDYTAL
jgi:hypothetical protein